MSTPAATPAPTPTWLRVTDDGVSIRIAAQPNARRNEIVGLHGDALKIKVASPPVEGAANAALVEFLAELLGVPRRAVELAKGATGRQKIIHIKGVSVADACRLLEPK